MEKVTQKPGCIIHCRVSSAKQAQEGESLEVQERISLGIVSDKGWVLVHAPWLESYSGRKNQRPTFEEILEFLDKHPGKVQYYVFRAIDRFTRRGSYTYEKMKRELSIRGVEMVDSYGIIQPPKNTIEDTGFSYDWSMQSPSEITEVVMATTSKQEVTTILTRLIGQEIRLTQQGYKMRAPHDGYDNKKVYVEGKKRTIQVPNERAKYYVAMMQMRAEGQLTDKEIVESVNAMGFRTRVYRRWDKSHQKIIGQTGGVPLTVKNMQAIVQRPILCGVICEKWTRHLPIKAQYPGMVSIDTFNLANRGKVFIKEGAEGTLEILYDFHPEKVVQKRTRNNALFPYKNVVRCPSCGKLFMGSTSTGGSGKKVSAYHCARGHERLGINKAIFDSAVEEFIGRLKFQPEIISSLHAVLLDRYRDKQAELVQSASDVGHSVVELEAQKAHAIRAFRDATSPVIKKEMEKEVEMLAEQIKSAQTERNKLEVKESDIDDFVANAKKIMERPAELLLNPVNIQQQQALFSLVFEELPTYTEILNGTPKLTWIFNVSSQSETPKSMLVRPPRFERGTLEV